MPNYLSHNKGSCQNLGPSWGQNKGLLGPKPCLSGGKGNGLNGTFGRGGGDRKDKLLNKACALYTLQPPPLSNWNKRNKNEASLPWAHENRLQQLHPFLLTTNVSNKSGICFSLKDKPNGLKTFDSCTVRAQRPQEKFWRLTPSLRQ